MEKILQQIKEYKPYNEQEEKDQKEMIFLLEHMPDLFLRENLLCHMTASAWVVNKEKTKVLMVYHNIYNSWSWLGGHSDGEKDLLKLAIQEVKEESGIKNVKHIGDGIFSLEILTVDGHIKNGKYVSSHLHLNVTYLLEANEQEELRIKPDENSGVAWFLLDEAIEASTETWFQKNVYPKLNEKLKEIQNLT